MRYHRLVPFVVLLGLLLRYASASSVDGYHHVGNDPVAAESASQSKQPTESISLGHLSVYPNIIEATKVGAVLSHCISHIMSHYFSTK